MPHGAIEFVSIIKLIPQQVPVWLLQSETQPTAA